MLNLYPVKVYASADQFYCSESDALFGKPNRRSIHIVFILIGLNDIRSLFCTRGISASGRLTYPELATAINHI